MSRRACAFALVVLATAAVPAAAATTPGPRYVPHVVVATLDTGTNPFHPAFRRSQSAHPSTFIPGYPASAPAARLRLGTDFDGDVDASLAEIEKFGGGAPVWVPGTNIVGTWAGGNDPNPIFDVERLGDPSHDHGAAASSQIAGRDFGLAPDTYLVVADWWNDGTNAEAYAAEAAALRWAADQPWIDVIHTNIQDVKPLTREEVPVEPNFPDAVTYAVSKGKIVVSAGGNYYAQPTQTSPHAGPPGVLVSGANDNCGYTEFSNTFPHVVMDGMGTAAASSNGYGRRDFSGTSSSSPRTTGYVADLLLRLRRAYGYTGGITADGALLTVPPGRRPSRGPLADGRLTAAELHEVVRKTANPRAHASAWDGSQALACIPEAVTTGPSFYPKMGYGEVSEHTAGLAYAVTVGAQPMPERQAEDAFYAATQEASRTFWAV